MRKWKEELLEQRRRMMEEKLLHAELKRELQLQAIVKKAQEEEAKVPGQPDSSTQTPAVCPIPSFYTFVSPQVNEIAFINTLEAQNKRHDALAKLNEYEQRLNELQEDRQRRQEEKQARDEAVQVPHRPPASPFKLPSCPSFISTGVFNLFYLLHRSVNESWRRSGRPGWRSS